jgi:hypothetical protein
MAVRLEKAFPFRGEKIKRPAEEGPLRMPNQVGRFEGLAKYGSCKMGLQVSCGIHSKVP